eukprot:2711780-Pleurochrysis_carterae.AAC.2
MRDSPDRRARPQPFVRGQACLVEADADAFGTCAARTSCPSTFTSGPASPLNVPYIAASLPAWPEARMLGYLTHGVRFEVDLPLQMVLFSHLISCLDGVSV